MAVLREQSLNRALVVERGRGHGCDRTDGRDRR
jgi:hypothetical protein